MAVFAVASVAAAKPRPGTLDPSFGGHAGDAPGLSTLGQSGGGLETQAGAVDSKGRIVVAGDRPGAGVDMPFFVARFKANGRLDKSFGSGGVLTETVPGKSVDARALSILPSGKILVAGGIRDTAGSNNQFYIAQMSAGGAFETSHAIDFSSSSSEEVFSIAREPADDKLILAGGAEVAGNTEWALARISASTLAEDNTFDGDGKLLTDWSPSTGFGAPAESASNVLVQKSGRIVAIGTAEGPTGTESEVALAGYSPVNGALDSSFGSQGLRALTCPGVGDQFPAGALISHDQIVVVATGFREKPSSGGGTPPEICLTRFDSKGRQDSSFGTDGVTVTEPPTNHSSLTARGLSVAPHGKLVVGGVRGDGPISRLMAARYTRNGRLDRAFGSHGLAAARIPNRIGFGESVAATGGRVISLGFAEGSNLSDSVVALAGFRG